MCSQNKLGGNGILTISSMFNITKSRLVFGREPSFYCSWLSNLIRFSWDDGHFKLFQYLRTSIIQLLLLYVQYLSTKSNVRIKKKSKNVGRDYSWRHILNTTLSSNSCLVGTSNQLISSYIFSTLVVAGLTQLWLKWHPLMGACSFHKA